MFKLAFTNVIRRRRSILMTVLVTGIAVLAVVLAAALGSYINEGMELNRERIGADVLIYPLGATSSDTQFLYSGIAEMVYMDKTVIDGKLPMEDVEAISPQFYLQTLPDGDCCGTDEIVRIVGIDRDTDFIVSPWYDTSDLADTDLVYGAQVNHFMVGTRNMLLGQFFDVRDELPASATSLDYSIYIDIDTARGLAENRFRQEDAMQYLPTDFDAERMVTCYLIRLKDGVDPDGFVERVKDNALQAQIVSINSAHAKLAEEMGSLAKVLLSFALVIVVLAGLALYAQFYNRINKRQREIGYFRSIGLRRRDIFAEISAEVAITGGIGGILGAVASLLCIGPVIDFLQTLFVLPTGVWSVADTLKWLLLGLAVAWVICLLAALCPALKSVKMEPAKAISEGEI